MVAANSHMRVHKTDIGGELHNWGLERSLEMIFCCLEDSGWSREEISDRAEEISDLLNTHAAEAYRRGVESAATSSEVMSLIAAAWSLPYIDLGQCVVNAILESEEG